MTPCPKQWNNSERLAAWNQMTQISAGASGNLSLYGPGNEETGGTGDGKNFQKNILKKIKITPCQIQNDMI